MQLEDIKSISIISAGIMGHGIGLTYALGGYRDRKFIQLLKLLYPQ